MAAGNVGMATRRRRPVAGRRLLFATGRRSVPDSSITRLAVLAGGSYLNLQVKGGKAFAIAPAMGSPAAGNYS
jgi:hypothetical protein